MNKTLFIFLGFLCLLLPAVSSAEMDIYRQVDTAKKCSICHYRWLSTFYIENRGTPLTPLEEEKVVGKQKMCLSCHDGSVLDSRDRICNDPGHRVGTVPSSKITIPENFPLDKNGALLCATCHTPHATTSTQEALVEMFLREANINSSLCKTCHGNKTGGKKMGNHPVDIEPDVSPSALLKLGGRLGTKPENHIICETCHIPHGGVNNKFLVLATDDPKTRSVLCEVCHTKKPGMDKNPSLNRFSHPFDRTPGFAKMPEKFKNGNSLVLGTGGELVCRSCHLPHGAADKKSLLIYENHKDSLCIQCHIQKKGFENSPHYLSVIDQNEKNIKGQRASEIGPCSPCHLAHQGSGKLMWARTSKLSDTEPGKICLSCHSPGNSGEKVMPGTFSHPIGIALSEEPQQLPLPLFDMNGSNRNGKIQCSTCHNFHNPSPLYIDSKNSAEKHSKFLRIKNNRPSSLCTACHPRFRLVEGTNHDLNITSPGFINAAGQQIVEGDTCSPCHMAHHNEQKKYLWSAPKGPSLLKGWEKTSTAPDNLMVMLCTGCHSSENSAKGKIPLFGLHPREIIAEGMLEININETSEHFPLFTDQGEVSETGNIVCSSCHNPHQWDPNLQTKGSGSKVEGNLQNSFLRPNLRTKYCSGCHGKDTIIKFKYFHKELGRMKEKKSIDFNQN
jgi:predicted CXXCH cytochrome family protein